VWRHIMRRQSATNHVKPHFLCVFFAAPWAPNAAPQPLPEAGATQERTLEAVGCRRWFGTRLGGIPLALSMTSQRLGPVHAYARPTPGLSRARPRPRPRRVQCRRRRPRGAVPSASTPARCRRFCIAPLSTPVPTALQA